MSNFNNYSHYYDLIYKDKNYLEEVLYIKNILTIHGVISGDILEFGSGTGKHGKLLSNYGYTVHGIDLSEKMIALAKIHKKKGFTCKVGDIADVKMYKTYDVVLSLFHVMSYQTSNDKLSKIFSNAANHLNKGGLFIFNFWYSPAVYKHGPSLRTKQVINNKTEITRKADPKIFYNENRIDVKYSITINNNQSGSSETFEEVHSMRHFSLPEIDLLAAYHGFNRFEFEEFLTAKPANENIWDTLVVLKKN